MSDDELIAKLVESAEAAIRNERPGLTYDRARLKGITVELTVFNSGAIINGKCYVQRSANLRRILGNDVPLPTAAGA
jgi:hypothetical protein